MPKKIDTAGLKHFKGKENAMIAGKSESTNTATVEHAVGEYFYWKGVLHIVTAAIAVGGTIQTNTNVKPAVLADDVSDLKTAITQNTPNIATFDQTFTNSNVTYTAFKETELAGSKPASALFIARYIADVEPDTDYYVTGVDYDNAVQIYIYSSLSFTTANLIKAFISGNGTFNSGDNTFVSLGIYIGPSATNFDITNIQIVKGTTEPNYYSAKITALDYIARGETSVLNEKINDLLSGFVTPQMFGAKADGTTNDYQAIADCISYAVANNKNVKFPLANYASESAITITSLIDLDFCNSSIEYTGSAVINDFIKFGFNPTQFNNYKGIKNVSIKGNAKAKNCLHISGGKGIVLSNIKISTPLECGLLIDNTDYDTWEIAAENIYASATNGTNSQALSAVKIDNVSDSFFKYIYAINGSDCWIYFNGNACTIINTHAYAYPNTFTTDVGLYVNGSGNSFINTIIDTFDDIGIKVLSPNNSFTNTGFTQPASNSCIGFSDETDYTVINGANCTSPITLIKSTSANALTVKNITTYGIMVKDVEFTRNALPYHFTYDYSGKATTSINSFINQSNIIDTSNFEVTGATINANPLIKKSKEFLRLSFSIYCTDTTVIIKTGITLPATQYIIAYNLSTNQPVLFSMWADGSIHNSGAVASGNGIYFDSTIAL